MVLRKRYILFVVKYIIFGLPLESAFRSSYFFSTSLSRTYSSKLIKILATAVDVVILWIKSFFLFPLSGFPLPSQSRQKAADGQGSSNGSNESLIVHFCGTKYVNIFYINQSISAPSRIRTQDPQIHKR